MKYVALLRGINVGGNTKVEMAKLKATFEQLGFTHVKTYINSGNVIFETSGTPTSTSIEAAISRDFGLSVPVLIRSQAELAALNAAIPADWTNDQVMKCDVLFLWKEIDQPSVINQVVHNPEIEDVVYAPGALVWRIDRANATKGKMVKIIGTPIYKQITVRNINTVRKLLDLMSAA